MPFIALTKDPTPLSLRQLLVLCFSNGVAYFDFLIFVFMADVINETFFIASNDPILTKLQTLSLFTAGYLARPIGGLLIGRYGDVKGRKPAMLMSMTFIACTTLIIACLPTYAQVGVIAPILFFCARLLQGIAFGAYTPLCWVYIAEHTSRRNLATLMGLLSSSLTIGALISNVFFDILTATQTHSEMITNGWRVPFIWGAMFSFIALMLWQLLDETPVFLEQARPSRYLPDFKNFKLSSKRFHAIFLSLMITFVISSATIIVALLLPDFINLKFSLDDSMLNLANNLGLLFFAIGSVFYGLIADRSSTGKTLLFGSVIFIIQILAFYHHLTYTEGSLILVMYALLGFTTGFTSLGPVILMQLFTTQTRLTAVSTILNIMYAIVGVGVPFGLMYATNLISFSPALYLTFVGIVSFMIGLYLYRIPKLRDLDDSLKL